MISPEARDVLDRAKVFYDERLKAEMERDHLHAYIAIEPHSGAYFLGKTLSEAANHADDALPDVRCAVLRIGHAAAVDLSNHIELIRPAGWVESCLREMREEKGC